VRLVRFGVFIIGRQHRLKAHERWLLEALAHLSDWKTKSYTGTLRELCEDTGIGKDTIPEALKTLSNLGLVKIETPFGSNRRGEVALWCWNQIITGSGDSSFSEKSDNEPPFESPTSRTLTADESPRSRTLTDAESPTSGTLADGRFYDHSPTILRPFSERWEFHQPEEAPVRNRHTSKDLVGSQQIQEGHSSQQSDAQRDLQKIDADNVETVTLEDGTTFTIDPCPDCGLPLRECVCPF